jgi:hypothetical protein
MMGFKDGVYISESKAHEEAAKYLAKLEVIYQAASEMSDELHTGLSEYVEAVKSGNPVKWSPQQAKREAADADKFKQTQQAMLIALTNGYAQLAISERLGKIDEVLSQIASM